MTLIVYDASGKIWVQIAGSYTIPTGMLYKEIEIPAGKYPIRVDTSDQDNHVVIYGDMQLDPISAKLAEIVARLDAHDNLIFATQDIAYMSLECSVQVYEQVLPFLP